jgi:hypothetical protein
MSSRSDLEIVHHPPDHVPHVMKLHAHDKPILRRIYQLLCSYPYVKIIMPWLGHIGTFSCFSTVVQQNCDYDCVIVAPASLPLNLFLSLSFAHSATVLSGRIERVRMVKWMGDFYEGPLENGIMRGFGHWRYTAGPLPFSRSRPFSAPQMAHTRARIHRRV